MEGERKRLGFRVRLYRRRRRGGWSRDRTCRSCLSCCSFLFFFPRLFLVVCGGRENKTKANPRERERGKVEEEENKNSIPLFLPPRVFNFTGVFWLFIWRCWWWRRWWGLCLSRAPQRAWRARTNRMVTTWWYQLDPPPTVFTLINFLILFQ